MSISTGASLLRGVVVEFDYAVLPGHALLREICAARLKAEGVAFDEILMARFLGGRSFASGLNALCNRQQKTVDVPAVIADCYEQFGVAMGESLRNLPTGFCAFVSAALARGMKVVLVTRGDTEAVRASLGEVSGERLVALHDVSSGFGFTGWDVWRRVARKSELYERLSVAVAGSGASAKGAMTSGFGVMLRESAWGAYQDASGSDVRFEAYSAALADEAARILCV